LFPSYCILDPSIAVGIDSLFVVPLFPVRLKPFACRSQPRWQFPIFPASNVESYAIYLANNQDGIHMLEKITAVLQQLKTQGSCSAKRTVSADDLHIKINPIGRLKFPLTPAVVKKLIKEARPAKSGWRDKTCLDTQVRDAWIIPKSRTHSSQL
jgi:hypothetical protein